MHSPEPVEGQRAPEGPDLVVPRWAGVVALASEQGGRVSRRQLLARGIGRSMIGDWLAKRLLTAVADGIYAVGHTAPTRLSKVWEGLLEEEDTVASTHTAGWLHDLMPAGEVVHVAVRDRSAHRRPGFRFHRPSTLRDEDVVHVDGVPTTSVARTIVDLAGALSYDRLRLVLKQAELRQVLDVTAIAGVLDHIARPRGVRNLRRALQDLPPLTRSRLERRFLDLCADAGLPEPVTNDRVEVGPGVWFEVDALWRAERLVVEVDGDAVHRGALARRDDEAKQQALEAAGFTVLRAPEHDLLFASRRVVRAVREVLIHIEGQRAPESPDLVDPR